MKIHKGHLHVDAAMKQAALEVLDSHQYYMGPQNDAFEEEVAAVLNIRHAVAINSGSSAMFLILKALGIGPGDEVIAPAAGFVTIAEAVANVGAKCRFVDIELDTYNLDATCLASAWNPAVRAIVPSHDYGHPADMESINAFASEHKLAVVEDCAHAFGASYRGVSAGGLGTAGFLSFAGKSISVCGLGGMVITNDDRIAQEVRLLRDHGRPRSQGKRFYDIQRVGYNLRLSELHAAIGRVQLAHLLEWNERRRQNAAFYNRVFAAAGIPVSIPHTRPEVVHAFLHYTLRVDALVRDPLMAYLAEREIETSILYPTPLHLLAPYREAWGYRPGDFPRAEHATRETLALPNHPSMTPEMLETVSGAVIQFFRERSK